MNKPHQRLGTVASRAGHMLVNGRLLIDVVRAAGGTPVYVYDRSLIAERVRELRAVLPRTVKIHYALKANPMPALACLMAGLVDGFDVASRHELLVALNSGAAPPGISFAGPGKSVDELRAAAAAGVVISVESETELRRLERVASELDREVTVILRLNPEFQLKRSGLAMTGYPSQFGIDVAQVGRIIDSIAERHIDVAGFQVYAGSQNLNAASLVECQRHTLALARDLAPMLPAGLRYLNMGGGFGIPYFEGEQPLDLAVIGDAARVLEQENAELFGTAEIVLELGRYLVGEAGYYVTRVTDAKTSRDTAFVIVDGGMNHHLANSGNLGQVLRRNFPLVVGNKVDHEPRERVTVTGPLCTPLDMVGDNVELPRVEVDDLIVVLQSGAYGFTASPHRFLSRPEPAEVLV